MSVDHILPTLCTYRLGALRTRADVIRANTNEPELLCLAGPRDSSLELRESRYELLDWLIGHAVSLHYADNAAAYPVVPAEAADAASSGPPPPLELSQEELNELAAVLELPTHADYGVLLRAVTSVLTSKFSPGAVSAAVAAKDEVRREIPLDYTPLGFATGDSGLDKACKVLRLLHISDLRDLQTKINELIVAVQNLTANPVTNSRLGKVGT